jgi:hypothetical protein
MLPLVGDSFASSVFGLCAILGGALFIIQLILRFTGILGDGEILDGAEFTHSDNHLSDSDVSFQWLSLQGFTVFFTMFGLVGLAVIQQKNHELLALALGMAAGIASVWIIQKLFQWAGKLQSKGNLEIENAVGLTGNVYLSIPANNSGQVTLTIQNQLRILEAISENQQPIQTGTQVQVIKVLNGKLLVVSEVQPNQHSA